MSRYPRGYEKVVKVAGLEKTAASRLRQMINITESSQSVMGGGKKYDIYLGTPQPRDNSHLLEGPRGSNFIPELPNYRSFPNDPIGHAIVSKGSLGGLKIDPRFQGMGIGRKVRGELTRRQPDVSLGSGSTITEDGLHLIESLKRRGHNVHQNPTAKRAPVPEYGTDITFTRRDLIKDVPGMKAPKGEDVFRVSLPEEARISRPFPKTPEPLIDPYDF